MTRRPLDGGWPVSQAFGEWHQRYSDYGLLGHNGVDFACPLDTQVRACAAGEVWESGPDPGWGNYIKVRTESGEDWLYAHLQPWILPRPGTWVSEGYLLGFSGTTGVSTGPHLHLGYRRYWWERGWPYNGYENPPIDPEEDPTWPLTTSPDSRS